MTIAEHSSSSHWLTGSNSISPMKPSTTMCNRELPVDRRTALGLIVASASSAFASVHARAEQPKKSGLGIVMYCCRIRREQMRKQNPKFDLYAPRNFLNHCRDLGAGGAQMRLGILDASDARSLRQVSQDYGMYIEAIISPPKEKKDVNRFDAEMKTAVAAGALAARTTIIPGRRYGVF